MLAVGFPGQGGQKVGMTQQISPTALDLFEEASKILGYDLLALCNNGPAEKLNATEYAQPAMLVTCYAIWQTVAEQMSVDVFIGHSLGEITALVAAGAIEFADGVRLVAKRGELMSKSPVTGGMSAVIGLDAVQVEELCQAASAFGAIDIANYNSPGQIVVSGENKALEYLAQQAVEAGARRVIPLAVSGPFHSPLMKTAAQEFAEFLDQLSFSTPLIPVVSNHRNQLITTAEEIKSELVEQLTSPVRWIDNILLLESMGVNELKEISPNSVLIGLTKRISKTISLSLVS